MLRNIGRMGLATLALVTLVGLTGCSDSHESVRADAADKMEEVVEILEGIETKDDLKAAEGAVDDWLEDMKELKERMDALEKPSKEELEAMDKKFEEDTKELQDRMMKVGERMGKNPELAMGFMGLMQKIGKAMQDMDK